MQKPRVCKHHELMTEKSGVQHKILLYFVRILMGILFSAEIRGKFYEVRIKSIEKSRPAQKVFTPILYFGAFSVFLRHWLELAERKGLYA
jgi:hypothetical protein